jgi:ubiquinone/menaquinone biosynthesis C-methylase UbiE
MTDQQETFDLKAAHRFVWGLGDYHEVAVVTIPQFGPELVAACGIGPGQRVLDVAAGAGNVAIPAAATGAEVIASDLTPELFEAGRSDAAAAGVELEWVEADAEALPFGDAEFDVVTSSVGAMFAPDHPAVARELLRVCRPGGTIGMINYTLEGFAGQFFSLLRPYTPSGPADADPPMAWGSEDHVRELLGPGVDSLEMTRKSAALEFPTPADLCSFYKSNFGPAIIAYASVGEDEERKAELDREFEEFAERSNQGEPGGPGVWDLEYLLVLARRQSD